MRAVTTRRSTTRHGRAVTTPARRSTTRTSAAAGDALRGGRRVSRAHRSVGARRHRRDGELSGHEPCAPEAERPVLRAALDAADENVPAGDTHRLELPGGLGVGAVVEPTAASDWRGGRPRPMDGGRWADLGDDARWRRRRRAGTPLRRNPTPPLDLPDSLPSKRDASLRIATVDHEPRPRGRAWRTAAPARDAASAPGGPTAVDSRAAFPAARSTAWAPPDAHIRDALRRRRTMRRRRALLARALLGSLGGADRAPAEPRDFVVARHGALASRMALRVGE